MQTLLLLLLKLHPVYLTILFILTICILTCRWSVDFNRRTWRTVTIGFSWDKGFSCTKFSEIIWLWLNISQSSEGAGTLTGFTVAICGVVALSSWVCLLTLLLFCSGESVETLESLFSGLSDRNIRKDIVPSCLPFSSWLKMLFCKGTLSKGVVSKMSD